MRAAIMVFPLRPLRKGSHSRMMVLTLTACPQALRGHLTRWLLEISPGVYVGNVTARVRDLLWEETVGSIGGGRAILVYSANTEQRLAFRTHGHDWVPTDFDGISLMMRPNENAKRESAEHKVGWSRMSAIQRARNPRR